jgi:hypothetical protein
VRHKIYLNTSISSIDFARLLGCLQENWSKTSKPLAGIKKAFAHVVPFKAKLWWLKDKIETQADAYGINLETLEIGGSAFMHEDLVKNSMYKITAELDVDFNKLIDVLSKPSPKPQNATEDKLKEAARIVKPFISTTMGTIPPAAVVELFELFGRDKLIEMAAGYGVKLKLELDST